MRTFIYAIHLFAVALLLFSKNTPPVKKAKLTFIMQKPMNKSFARDFQPEVRVVKVKTPRVRHPLSSQKKR